MPTTTWKTRNKKKLTTTMPDLCQPYRRAGEVGSLPGASKPWTAQGRRPASRAIGKAMSAKESYTLHRPVCYRFPWLHTIVSGPGEQLQSDLVVCSKYQVSFLLHRCVFQVCQGTSSHQKARHWDSGCHAGHPRWNAGRAATGCAER